MTANIIFAQLIHSKLTRTNKRIIFVPYMLTCYQVTPMKNVEDKSSAVQWQGISELQSPVDYLNFLCQLKANSYWFFFFFSFFFFSTSSIYKLKFFD